MPQESQCERNPLIKPEVMTLRVMVDPLNIGVMESHIFQHKVYTLVETETTVQAVLRGKTIQTGNTYNDFYGLGNSVDSAIEEAKALMSKFEGTGIDVELLTKISMRPVVLDENKPAVWRGGVSVFSIGHGVWRIHDTGETGPLLQTQERNIVTWKNGKDTEDRILLTKELERHKAEDAVAHLRKP